MTFRQSAYLPPSLAVQLRDDDAVFSIELSDGQKATAQTIAKARPIGLARMLTAPKLRSCGNKGWVSWS